MLPNNGLCPHRGYGPPIIRHHTPVITGRHHAGIHRPHDAFNSLYDPSENSVGSVLSVDYRQEEDLFSIINQRGPRNTPYGHVIHGTRQSAQQPITPTAGSSGLVGRNHRLQPQPAIHRTQPSVQPQGYPIILVDPSLPKGSVNQGDLTKRQLEEWRNNRQDDYQKQKKQRDVHRKEIKAIGGACLWCTRMHKGCDTNSTCSPCEKKGRVCIRGPEKLSLLRTGSVTFPGSPGLTRPNREAIPQGTGEEAFASVKELVQSFSSQIDPQYWGDEAVLKFRYLSDSASLLAIDTSLLMDPPDFTDPSSLSEQLQIDTVLGHIPTPRISYFPEKTNDSSLLPPAILMIRLYALVISITDAGFYAIPGHLSSGRAALTFLLARLAKILAQQSRQFASKLYEKLYDIRKQTGDGYDVWLAIGLYYNVAISLRDFNPPSAVIDVFAALKHNLENVCSALKSILKNIYHRDYNALGPHYPGDCSADQRRRTTFVRQVPPPPILESFEIAFHFSSPVPTALARQAAPFSLDPIAVSELLSNSFENGSPTLPGPCEFLETPRDPFAAAKWNLPPLPSPSQPFQQQKQPTGRECGSDRVVEHGSSRTSEQGTMVPPVGEAGSTLFGGSNIDNEDNRGLQSGETLFDMFFDMNRYNADKDKSTDQDFETFSGDAYNPDGVSYRGGHKRNRSLDSASSNRSSRPERKKQLHPAENIGMTDYLRDIHPENHCP